MQRGILFTTRAFATSLPGKADSICAQPMRGKRTRTTRSTLGHP
jgi:hypothetical protein